MCPVVFAEEMHAEICYAECLLQKATLTFVQVRSARLDRVLPETSGPNGKTCVCSRTRT